MSVTLCRTWQLWRTGRRALRLIHQAGHAFDRGDRAEAALLLRRARMMADRLRGDLVRRGAP